MRFKRARDARQISRVQIVDAAACFITFSRERLSPRRRWHSREIPRCSHFDEPSVGVKWLVEAEDTPMAFAEELWALDRDREIGSGVAVDTITNFWANATGWIEAYGGRVFIVLLLLISVGYLIWVGRQPQT
jgi:hypothetical protein